MNDKGNIIPVARAIAGVNDNTEHSDTDFLWIIKLQYSAALQYGPQNKR